jgi:hypothetical protein
MQPNEFDEEHETHYTGFQEVTQAATQKYMNAFKETIKSNVSERYTATSGGLN